MRVTVCLPVVTSISFITVASAIPAAAQLPASPAMSESDRTPIAGARSPVDWQARTRNDLAAFAEAARANYIYAAYPTPNAWRRQFEQTLRDVETKIPLVHDEAGYRAVLKYLSITFHDAHVGVQFPTPSQPTNWPGFLARFDNGTYRITASTIGDVADGSELSACDGKPVYWWTNTIVRYEIGFPAKLETARMMAALRLFVDHASPLRPRPSRCTIAGRDVALHWRPTTAATLDPSWTWLGVRKAEANTRLIGGDGAWVRLGFFEPQTKEQATAFHAAIDAAASLRDKRYIVLDVRGNGGGPYNWFMGYLRGLYGQAYADYHATARLQIRAVYRLSPAALANDQRDQSAAETFGRPPDPPYEINDAADEAEEAKARAAGKPYFQVAAIPIARGQEPPNPVHAKVYVLTDYGCASACIGFVDELKRFPGVEQIGLPTAVDSRSGTAASIPLPSGLATAHIATMTRDGRERGDNVPQLPAIRFLGDIRDDRAVEDWVVRTVVPH